LDFVKIISFETVFRELIQAPKKAPDYVLSTRHGKLSLELAATFINFQIVPL